MLEEVAVTHNRKPGWAGRQPIPRGMVLPYDRKDEPAIIAQAQAGDCLAMARLLRQHERYCWQQARRVSSQVQFLKHGITANDLFSVFQEGVYDAAMRWLPNKGSTVLMTQVVWWCRAAISRYRKEALNQHRLPSVLVECLGQALHDTGKSFPAGERTDITNELFVDALLTRVRRAYPSATRDQVVASVNALYSQRVREQVGDETEGDTFGMVADIATTPPDHDDRMVADDIEVSIETLLGHVEDVRDRHIIYARFFENKTLSVVGEELGVTRERVRQIEIRALSRLRRVVAGDKQLETDLRDALMALTEQ